MLLHSPPHPPPPRPCSNLRTHEQHRQAAAGACRLAQAVERRVGNQAARGARAVGGDGGERPRDHGGEDRVARACAIKKKADTVPPCMAVMCGAAASEVPSAPALLGSCSPGGQPWWWVAAVTCGALWPLLPLRRALKVTYAAAATAVATLPSETSSRRRSGAADRASQLLRLTWTHRVAAWVRGLQPRASRVAGSEPVVWRSIRGVGGPARPL